MLRSLVIALSLLSGIARAFDVNPVVSVIEIPGDGAGITLTLNNPRTVELPVVFEIVERAVAEDGSETYAPADDLFSIFPPQAVVAPGKSQSLRVQWLGGAPPQSRSFTLFAEEQAVDLTQQDEFNVQTVFRIGASVHVTDRRSRPQAQLVSAVPDGDGVRVTLGNTGTRFYYINDVKLDFAGTSIGGIDLANIANRTLIPPGARRSFVVPKVSGTPTLDVDAR